MSPLHFQKLSNFLKLFRFIIWWNLQLSFLFDDFESFRNSISVKLYCSGAFVYCPSKTNHFLNGLVRITSAPLNDTTHTHRHTPTRTYLKRHQNCILCKVNENSRAQLTGTTFYFHYNSTTRSRCSHNKSNNNNKSNNRLYANAVASFLHSGWPHFMGPINLYLYVYLYLDSKLWLCLHWFVCVCNILLTLQLGQAYH